MKITNLAEKFGVCIETIQMNELLEQNIFVVLWFKPFLSDACVPEVKPVPPFNMPANSRRISGRRLSPSGGREATTGNASAVRRLSFNMP